MSFLYFTGIFFFIKNFVPSTTNKYFLFVTILSLFFFKTMGINIIRQGIAVVLILNAYNYYFRKKYLLTGILCVLALNFHLTVIIPIGLFIIAKFVKNIWGGIILYTFGIIISYFGIGLTALINYVPALSGLDPRFQSYINKDRNWLYDVGFKPQFVVFNTFFLIIALLIRKSITETKEKENYNSLINYYTFGSFLFFMAFQIAYSDRWGIFPWISIPILLYPLMKPDVPNGRATVLFIGSVLVFIFFNMIYTS